MRKTLHTAVKLTTAISLSALMACTTDPYTGEEKASNAGMGAGIGAGLGAIAGALSGGTAKERRNRALAGAAGGAAVGGGIGYYMDQQENKLRQTLRGSGVSVKRTGDNLQLVMPGNITFASGRYEIKADFYKVLDSVALVLKEFDKTSIRVTGHTDSVGSAASNQQLSQARSSSVATYLSGRNVSGSRIQSVGAGESSPVASNDTASGRNANRRVELDLIPPAKI